jgi:two-component system response regulator PilR (NtrC family)
MSIPRVLVVDDDVVICRILHRMLSDEQYQVQTSQSVADALAAIEQKSFDVYVMDNKLPDGSGLDVAERLRSKGSEAPIILISAYDQSAGAPRAEKLRIFDTIQKPFSREIICDAVKKAIELSPIADQRDAKTVSPSSGKAVSRSSGKSVSPSSVKPAATRKHFPKAAMIGVIILVLLLVCLAFYLLTHGH